MRRSQELASSFLLSAQTIPRQRSQDSLELIRWRKEEGQGPDGTLLHLFFLVFVLSYLIKKPGKRKKCTCPGRLSKKLQTPTRAKSWSKQAHKNKLVWGFGLGAFAILSFWYSFLFLPSFTWSQDDILRLGTWSVIQDIVREAPSEGKKKKQYTLNRREA